MIWDTCAALEPHSVKVVGGQLTGVGLADFILGGGKSDQSLHSIRTVTQISRIFMAHQPVWFGDQQRAP